ncbi:MAG: GNAT family N-acetyltransferase [Promethearchaeota archaeon]
MNELYHLKINEDQIEVASGVLSRAFQDDPLFIYLYPNSLERKKNCFIHCEHLILLGILSGEVYITSSKIEGVSVWHPSGIPNVVIGSQSKDIIRKLRKIRRELFSDPISTEKYSTFNEIINSFQNVNVNFPHWYLSFIGVDPINQGKGYGNMLLKTKLAEIDGQNLDCFLHTENEKNIQIYKHFGFEIVAKLTIPNSELNAWAMVRKKKGDQK